MHFMEDYDMNIYVLNKLLERVALIDNFSSIIWTNKYYECGDFELYLAATEELINILREDYYLIREGKEENAMIIESIQISTDAENGNYITVTGRCLKSVLYRRIIWNQTNLNGLIELGISTLLNENVIKPVIMQRRISNFINNNTLSTGVTMSAQYTGDNLGETIESICMNYGIGWDVKLNLEKKQFEFVLYKGVDRSYNQQTIPWVVFSGEYENMLTSNYTFDKSNYKNVCKVAGEGEGILRKYTTVGNAEGLERYESFVDARDLSTNEGETSDEEYNKQLTERGSESLAESVTTEDFEGEIIDYTYNYGEDYYLGDIVEVVNDYGMEATTRVIEVTESEDDSGINTIPTFSAYK